MIVYKTTIISYDEFHIYICNQYYYAHEFLHKIYKITEDA